MQTNAKSEMPAAWLGIDVSKNSFDVGLHLPVEYGQPAREIGDILTICVDRTCEGVTEALSWAADRCQAFAAANNCQVPAMRAVMEATGRFSMELCSWITSAAPEIRPVIDDPRAIRNYAQSLKVRNKTDAVDAAVLARYGAERMPEPHPAMPSHYAELRQRTRLRGSLVGELVAARERLDEIQGSPVAARIQKKLVKALEGAVAEADRAVIEQVKQHSDLQQAVNLMTTIPGVGFKVATVTLAECGPLQNFKRSRAIGSYSGLAPSRRESGTSVRGGTRIARRGPGILRQSLYMASINAGNKIEGLAQIKKRMVEKGKSPMSARCAVMRKLLILMRAVVVNDTEFRAEYCHFTDQKTFHETA